MNQQQWKTVDTVLLDMDGTLLDLNYDNYVWNTLVPQAYAEQNNLSADTAKETLFQHMMSIKGTIEFYSFEYWTQHCNFDNKQLVSIHQQAAQLIQYRSGVITFLRRAKSARGGGGCNRPHRVAAGPVFLGHQAEMGAGSGRAGQGGRSLGRDHRHLSHLAAHWRQGACHRRDECGANDALQHP